MYFPKSARSHLIWNQPLLETEKFSLYTPSGCRAGSEVDLDVHWATQFQMPDCCGGTYHLTEVSKREGHQRVGGKQLSRAGSFQNWALDIS